MEKNHQILLSSKELLILYLQNRTEKQWEMNKSNSFSTHIQHWGRGDNLRLPVITDSYEIDMIMNLVVPYQKKLSQSFQSRHLSTLKRNKWFVLKRPTCRTRTGLLAVLPEKACCLYIGFHNAKQSTKSPIAILRLRVDPQFFAPGTGITVFSATLSAQFRALQIEDVLVWKGMPIRETKVFEERLLMASQWLNHYCVADPKLIGGIRLSIAEWGGLCELKEKGEGVWEFIENTVGAPRLLWIPQSASQTGLTNSSLQRKDERIPKQSTRLLCDSSPLERIDETIPNKNDLLPTVIVTELVIQPAIKQKVWAIPSGGPELWNLVTQEGLSLGRALIRKMAISTALRDASKSNSQISVDAIWNATFKKWEIIAV